MILRRGFLLSLLLPVGARPLTEVQERGLVVGVYLSGYPLAFRDETGRLQGLEVELARRFGTELGPRPVVLQELRTSERLTAVATGAVDFVIGNLSVTAQRARVVDFSVGYYRPYQALLVQRNDPAQTLGDLVTARVAVLAGSSSVVGLKRWLPKAVVVTVSSYARARELLEQGIVQAVSADNTVLVGWQRENPSLRLLPAPLNGYVLAIGLPKGIAHQDLRVWVNERLTQWQLDGSLAQAQRRWGL
ncbi:ABC transporter substrate-binding protein [Candidatus Cyanaurora vandensis]|uniref:substrate-binding periplasmic protein n=1 Tax=Candidatus Cyanaurora vandensis TaxID=2714958 RepID=UPI00257EDC30|nr:transporter substrate-binding domain-containing protein [Candidatus Cyanaurora vandensis]